MHDFGRVLVQDRCFRRDFKFTYSNQLNFIFGPTDKKRGTGSQKILEWIAIQRDDTGEWSIPGGMIRDGEAEFVNGEVLIKVLVSALFSFTN